MKSQDDIADIRFPFLRLPAEIIHKILCFVHPVDLLQGIATTNRLLHETIVESIQLQYKIALYRHGIHDNPLPNVSIQQRLERLQQRESAFLSIKPSFTRSFTCDGVFGGLYELKEGVLFMGDREHRERLFYLPLPTSGTEEIGCRLFNPKKAEFILDFGLSVEHELIVLVQMSLSPDEHQMHAITLSFHQFTTSSPHPAARQPLLTLHRSAGDSRPFASIEILGDFVFLVLEYIAPSSDSLYIINWKTGEHLLNKDTRGDSWFGIVLLSTEHFMIPNIRKGALDIYQVPSSPIVDVGDNDSYQPVLSLGLPSLAAGFNYHHVSCRAEPNPAPLSSQSSSGDDEAWRKLERRRSIPYSVPASSAMIMMHLAVDLDPELQLFRTHFNLGGLEQGQYTLFIRRESLLGIIEEVVTGTWQNAEAKGDKAQTGDDEDGAFHSDEWDSDGDSSAGDFHSQGFYFTRGRQDNPQTPTSSSAKASPSSVIPWETWGPPISSIMSLDELRIYCPWITATYGQRFAAVRELDEITQTSIGVSVELVKRLVLYDFNPCHVRELDLKRRGGQDDSEEELKNVYIRTQSHTLSAPYLQRKGNRRGGGAVESSLPFVAYAVDVDSAHKYETVMMDGDWLIGVDPIRPGQTSSTVEVMYFG